MILGYLSLVAILAIVSVIWKSMTCPDMKKAPMWLSLVTSWTFWLLVYNTYILAYTREGKMQITDPMIGDATLVAITLSYGIVYVFMHRWLSTPTSLEKEDEDTGARP